MTFKAIYNYFHSSENFLYHSSHSLTTKTLDLKPKILTWLIKSIPNLALQFAGNFLQRRRQALIKPLIYKQSTSERRVSLVIIHPFCRPLHQSRTCTQLNRQPKISHTLIQKSRLYLTDLSLTRKFVVRSNLQQFIFSFDGY